MTSLPPAPRAKRRIHRIARHGHILEDPYHWLRDPAYPELRDPEVLAYLEAENAYFEAAMAPHQGLIDDLFAEMKGRIKQDDSSVPARDGDFLYWWAYQPGAQYPRWLRRPIAGGDAQLIFDEAAEAEGKEYFLLDALKVSPDARLIATMVDDTGSERFTLRIRDLATGKDEETITDVGIGAPVWSADGSAILFCEVDDKWRSYRARMHRLGTPVASDITIYEEQDPGFTVGLSRSQDRSLIFISSSTIATSEVRFVSAAAPEAAPTLIRARETDLRYEVDAGHGRLWILTNDAHINFRIAEADPAAPAQWKTVIAGSERVYLRGLTAFRDHLAVTQRVDGLDQLLLRGYDGAERRIPFPEAAYTAWFGNNPEYAPAAYRLGYSSMVTPSTVYDYHPAEDRLEVRKVAEIPSGYDASRYTSERLMVPARDGKKVPVSIVYRRDFAKDGTGKLLLYGYGAYGHAIMPQFSALRLSLLDRGFAFAIAHIRGGDELGFGWYLDGRLDRRTNSFNDFVDCARGLIAAGFTRAGNIAIRGGSAGGELVGAVANSDPDLWGAVVADVPFVDVLNTMLDGSLPLTPLEWPEWGNPVADKAAFETILSYSPYENVRRQAYPAMLITGGLADPRVTYWEPAKWAARLRAEKRDDHLLLLKINMGAGHGGKSGRWDSIREEAEAYAFLVTQMGGA
ncbi:MAG TPA: S9 family peptidase [Allosphingosinicella sp.]|nr:S9 family peptidase [Allosphingosinicella sp.]